MVPLDRALVSSYRLSIVTMSLTAAVWPQFATQVFRGGIGRLTCTIGSYANKQVTTFTFRAQPTTCSKHHTRTVMDACCECAPWVRSANPSDSWALVIILSLPPCGKLATSSYQLSHHVVTASLHYPVKYTFRKITTIRINIHKNLAFEMIVCKFFYLN